jgi:hypothetical protein
MRRLIGISLVMIALGAGRIAFYYLIYEPAANLRGTNVGAEFEPLRPLVNAPRVSYLSDEPVDADPRSSRDHDRGDMMYARAQYALAPVVLAHADPDLPVAIANFADRAGLDRLLAAGRYEVVARPSATIALLRRK